MSASAARTAPRRDERSEPAEELGRAFKQATVAMRRLRGRETHHPAALSYAQYTLLFGLAGGGAMSTRELAFAADLTPATVTQMLDSLEMAGLVGRVRSDRDKRIVLTSLTDEGCAVVQERRARYEPLWRAALAEFSDDELATAGAVLGRIAHLFDEMAEG
jgi:DNA-binding MarR family transcriptional regulator